MNLFSITKVIAPIVLAILFVGCATTNKQINSGLWHFNSGLYNQAIPLLVDGVDSLQKSNPKDPRLPTAYVALGDMASTEKRPDIAEKYYKQAIKSAESYHEKDETLSRNAYAHIGNFYLAQKRFSEAVTPLERATEISKNSAIIPRNLHAIDLDNLSIAVSGIGHHDEANAISERALATLSDLPSSSEIKTTRGVIFYNMAYRFEQQGNITDADTYYRQAWDNISTSSETWRIQVVRTRYANFLRQVGRNNEVNSLEHH